jgi:hypothetical protein
MNRAGLNLALLLIHPTRTVTKLRWKYHLKNDPNANVPPNSDSKREMLCFLLTLNADVHASYL